MSAVAKLTAVERRNIGRHEFALGGREFRILAQHRLEERHDGEVAVRIAQECVRDALEFLGKAEIGHWKPRN